MAKTYHRTRSLNQTYDFPTRNDLQRNKKQPKKRAAGILFLFSGVSDPLPEITPEYLGSEIEYEGHLFTLEKITVNKNPFSSEVYSYELEVI
jgi:hypothetical protein